MGTNETNLSTEHQREGDARRPSDTLDRGQTEGGSVERGQPASFDRRTGEVHGAGSGAGGAGNPREDFDSDAAAGAGSMPVEGPRSQGPAEGEPQDRRGERDA